MDTARSSVKILLPGLFHRIGKAFFCVFWNVRWCVRNEMRFISARCRYRVMSASRCGNVLMGAICISTEAVMTAYASMRAW